MGEIGGDVFEGGGEPPHLVTGVHALSNALAGERWAKVGIAEDEMRAIAASGGSFTFVEESYARGGVPDGSPRRTVSRYSVAFPIV